MREPNHRFLAVPTAAALALAAALVAGGCSLDKQQTPGLSGPSEVGASVELVAAPDTLNADGISASVVRITLRDNDGKPLSGRPVLFQHDGDGYISPSSASTFVGPVQSGLVMATDKDGNAYILYIAGTSLRTVTVTVRPYGVDTSLTFFRTVEIFQL